MEPVTRLTNSAGGARAELGVRSWRHPNPDPSPSPFLTRCEDGHELCAEVWPDDGATPPPGAALLTLGHQQDAHGAMPCPASASLAQPPSPRLAAVALVVDLERRCILLTRRSTGKVPWLTAADAAAHALAAWVRKRACVGALLWCLPKVAAPTAFDYLGGARARCAPSRARGCCPADRPGQGCGHGNRGRNPGPTLTRCCPAARSTRPIPPPPPPRCGNSSRKLASHPQRTRRPARTRRCRFACGSPATLRRPSCGVSGRPQAAGAATYPIPNPNPHPNPSPTPIHYPNPNPNPNPSPSPNPNPTP